MASTISRMTVVLKANGTLSAAINQDISAVFGLDTKAPSKVPRRRSDS